MISSTNNDALNFSLPYDGNDTHFLSNQSEVNRTIETNRFFKKSPGTAVGMSTSSITSAHAILFMLSGALLLILIVSCVLICICESNIPVFNRLIERFQQWLARRRQQVAVEDDESNYNVQFRRRDSVVSIKKVEKDNDESVNNAAQKEDEVPQSAMSDHSRASETQAHKANEVTGESESTENMRTEKDSETINSSSTKRIQAEDVSPKEKDEVLESPILHQDSGTPKSAVKIPVYVDVHQSMDNSSTESRLTEKSTFSSSPSDHQE